MGIGTTNPGAIFTINKATSTANVGEVGKVAVGVGPIQVFVTADNNRVLVANQGTEDAPGTTVSIVDVATFSVVGTVVTGRGAHGIVIDPSGRYAYVTNIYGDNVAVLDIARRDVIATIPSGAGPNGISYSPIAPAAPQAPRVELELPMTDMPAMDM